EIRCGFTFPGCHSRSRVLSAHGDFRQVTSIGASQMDRRVARAGVAGPNVQGRWEGVVADVRSIVAGSAVTLKRSNASANQAPGCHIVIYARDAGDGDLQSVENLLAARDRTPGGVAPLVI